LHTGGLAAPRSLRHGRQNLGYLLLGAGAVVPGWGVGSGGVGVPSGAGLVCPVVPVAGFLALLLRLRTSGSGLKPYLRRVSSVKPSFPLKVEPRRARTLSPSRSFLLSSLFDLRAWLRRSSCWVSRPRTSDNIP